ncbi:MAG: hypothetical protein ACYSWR_03815, partial [Planctomycetota bacterium]
WSLAVSWAGAAMAVIAIINIIITRRTIEGFELHIFIRHHLTGITYETGVTGNSSPEISIQHYILA